MSCLECISLGLGIVLPIRGGMMIELITPVVDILEIMEQRIHNLESRLAKVEEHSRCHELLCRLERQDEENKRMLGIHE